MIFRMNWYDFENNRFQYDGIIYNLYQRKYDKVLMLKTRIMFVLNIHREQWIKSNDITDFIYGEIHPDDWPEHLNWILATTISNMRKALPDGIRIISCRGFGYKLSVTEEKP